MASQVEIVNIALLRIGARGVIASIDESSPNATKANAVWDAVYSEVLQIRNWKFAKLRIALQKSTTTPLYGYSFAYALPTDFLRLVRQKTPETVLRNPVGFPTGGFYAGASFSGAGGIGLAVANDPPVWPPGFDYITETLSDRAQYLLTNYDNSSTPLYINYIRLITDYTRLTPAFVNCLADRLAAELAISITEDKEKAAMKMQDYRDNLNSAEAQNEGTDYLPEEAGSTRWEHAGR